CSSDLAGSEAVETQRRVLRSDLLELAAEPELMEEVLDAFAVYRLLSLDRDPVTRSATVEVAHAALLREWARLRHWLEEHRQDIQHQRQLATLAAEWHEAGEDPSFLLHGARLAQLEAWAGGTDLALTGYEQAYLAASTAEHQRQQAEEAQRQAHELALKQRAAARLRVLAGVLIVAVLVVSAAALVALRSSQRAEEQRRMAFSRELAASAISNLELDPERSVLLALHAVAEAETLEAVNALHRALPELHIVQTLSGHEGAVNDIAANAADDRLASVGEDGTIRVWEVETGRVLYTIGDAHGGARVFGVAFSPANDRLASAGADGTVRLWDRATGAQLAEIAAHDPEAASSGRPGAVAVVFSPDGRLLASGGADRFVRLWDAQTGEELLAIRAHNGPGASM